MNDRPTILVTNDDGVNANGIHSLATCLMDLGNVVVFAPDGPRSGMSSAITSDTTISYQPVTEMEHLRVYACTGTPTDCVKLAMNEVLDKQPDLLVSGINHGGNMAISVLYSGTLGAAAEGCVLGIPSIGVSLLKCGEDADFTESCRLAHAVASRVMKEGLPSGTYLNLNVPHGAKVKGIRVCRQAAGRWVAEYERVIGTDGNLEFQLTGSFENAQPIHPDNDTLALDNGYASLVPCRIDVTDYEWMEKYKNTFSV